MALTLDPFWSSVCDLAASKPSSPKGIDLTTSSPTEEDPSRFPFSPPPEHCRERTPQSPPRWLLGEGCFWLEKIRPYEGRKAKRERKEDRNRAGDGGGCRARLPQVSAQHRAIFCLFLFLTAASPWQPHQLSGSAPDSASRSVGIFGGFFSAPSSHLDLLLEPHPRETLSQWRPETLKGCS